jgi:hypothetical protein
MLNHKKNQKIININEKFCIYKNYFLEQEIEDYFYTVYYYANKMFSASDNQLSTVDTNADW